MSWVIRVVLDWLLVKVTGLLSKYIDNYKRKKVIEKKNDELIDKLEKAQTKEARDEAARDIINNF